MSDSKEERKYEQVRKLGQELHIPIFEAFWELGVIDKDRKVLQTLKQRSHSWTRNAYNMMFSQLAGKDAADDTFGAGLLNIKNTDGVVQYGAKPITHRYDQSMDLAVTYGYRGPAGNDLYGILVGTGENAESFEDYALQTLIDDGTAAGELSYIEGEAHAIDYNAGTKVLKNDMVRYFNNNSDGAIGVNEVALVLSGIVNSSTQKWLQARDKLGATVTVPDAGQLKVTYTISLTYPA